MIFMADLQAIVEKLLKYDNEKEWFEFKENWFELDELGRYILNSRAICSTSPRIRGSFYFH